MGLAIRILPRLETYLRMGPAMDSVIWRLNLEARLVVGKMRVKVYM